MNKNSRGRATYLCLNVSTFHAANKFPPNAKAIDRRSDWGNPHKVFSPGVPDRATAVALYERDLLAGTLKGYRTRRTLTVADAKRELRGFDLMCSGCKEDGLPCHGDVLLRIANA